MFLYSNIVLHSCFEMDCYLKILRKTANGLSSLGSKVILYDIEMLFAGPLIFSLGLFRICVDSVFLAHYY